MLGRRLSALLLQQCAASQQQLQQCCWAAAASGMSTSAANHAAAAVSAASQTSAPQGATATQAATSDGTSAKSWLGAKQQQLLNSSFEQLHQDIQQQFALQSPRTEATLLALISKAVQEEQVQAAVAAVRVNYLKRCRIRQAQMFSPHVFNALLKAGHRAGLQHSFAVQLLEQANQLGLQTSRSICEDVIVRCLNQKDYHAAAQAWVYAQLYCATPGSCSSGADLQGESSRRTADSTAAEGATGSLEGAWASKSIIRVYLKGMSQWLVEGGLSKRHKQRLHEQLEGLAKELKRRGAVVPDSVQEALDTAAASSSSSSIEAGTSASDDTEKQPSVADAVASPNA